MPENEFANIRIGDTQGVIKKSKQNIKLDTEKSTITVPIVITSQDETVTKTYNIMFVRLSNDTTIQWLEVNNKHIIEDENGNYEVICKSNTRYCKCKNYIIKYFSNCNYGRRSKTSKT